MPNPMYLKIMDMELSEYNTLTHDEKQEFTDEARQRVADLSADPEQYTDFTNSLAVAEERIPRTFKRSKRNKAKETE